MKKLEEYFSGSNGSCAVVGAQWGDEGKGKISDILAQYADAVVRWQGGPNAGHTVKIDDKKHVTHHLPVGILHDDTESIIGQGCVVDPYKLREELKSFSYYHNDGVTIDGNATLILPWHRKIDDAHDENEKGEEIIGTTSCGVGPTYASRADRVAIRARDIKLPEDGLTEKLKDQFEWCCSRAKAKDIDLNVAYFKTPGDVARDLKAILQTGSVVHDAAKLRIEDASKKIEQYLNDTGKNVLFEGAQGTMLGLYSGNYPYVTSSDPTVRGIPTGCGIPSGKIDHVVGVMKAYTTRVGGNEDNFICGDAMNEPLKKKIREKGDEYGATTGRRRKIGWIDLPALRYADNINNFDELIMTKPDVLSEIKESWRPIHGYEFGCNFTDLQVVAKYREYDHDKNTTVGYIDSFSPNLNMEKLSAFPKKMGRWHKNIQDVKDISNLPCELINYIDYIGDELDTEIDAVSVGPKRNQIAT